MSHNASELPTAAAEALVRGAQRQIELETARAIQQIRQEVVDLSLAVASKLIKKSLTKEDNDALIQDSLRQIDASRN